VTLEDELEARLSAWGEIRTLSASRSLVAADVNALRGSGLRVFRSGRGIWTDKARTAELAADGVTVGVLHTGRTYADDLLDDGIVYHYPVTRAPGRDAQEVNATKAAKELGLPLFVVVQPDGSSRRLVHLSWVEDWDDPSGLFLIAFGEGPPSRDKYSGTEDDHPFELERSGGDDRRKGVRSARSGQARFSFHVFRRYGPCCAVCEVAVIGLLQAAHVRPVADRGTDDPRNGLVLCATHHLAFDKQLFAVNPASLAVVCRPGGPDELALGMARSSIAHLGRRPHAEALEWRWSRFNT